MSRPDQDDGPWVVLELPDRRANPSPGGEQPQSDPEEHDPAASGPEVASHA